MDHSPPASSVHEIFQARILEWVASSFSKYIHVKQSEVAQSCRTLCDPMDCSLSGSSVHGILQARIVEWVAMPSSRGSSWPRDRTRVSCIVGRRFTIWATREALSTSMGPNNSLMFLTAFLEPSSSYPSTSLPAFREKLFDWCLFAFFTFLLTWSLEFCQIRLLHLALHWN